MEWGLSLSSKKKGQSSTLPRQQDVAASFFFQGERGGGGFCPPLLRDSVEPSAFPFSPPGTRSDSFLLLPPRSEKAGGRPPFSSATVDERFGRLLMTVDKIEGFLFPPNTGNQLTDSGSLSLLLFLSPGQKVGRIGLVKACVPPWPFFFFLPSGGRGHEAARFPVSFLLTGIRRARELLLARPSFHDRKKFFSPLRSGS